MITLTNSTKSVSKIGALVSISTVDPNAFVYTIPNSSRAIGVCLEAVPYRQKCKIATIGDTAKVLVQGNTLKDDILRGAKSNDNVSLGTCKIAKDSDAPYLKIGTALGAGTGLIETILELTYTGNDSLSAEIDAIEQEIADIHTAMQDPTGFENRTDSAWTFTDGTRKLEVTTVSGYNIWFDGVKHRITTTKDIEITDAEGIHLVYFDTDDTLKEYVNPTTANLLTAIRDKCLVGIVYWDATNNVGVYVGEERHGCVMDGITHYYLHFTRGLQLVSGLGLGDFVIGNGSLDSHAQFSVATGLVADEDIGLTISAIGSTTGLPILYLTGASSYWRTVTQAGFSCYQNPAGVTNRLMYNQYTLGAWQLTEVSEGNYVLYHVFATTGKVKQMYSIMGQAEYTTLPNARAGAQTEISSLVLGNLPSPEIRPVATVIFQTDKDYANTINARVVEAETGVSYIDWRTSELPRGVAPSDHGNLTGLQDDDHLIYELSTTIRPASIVNTTTTPYAVLSTDVEIYVDATAGAKIVNLPLATGSGRKLTIKKVAGAVGNTVTVTADATGVADLIDGAGTVVLSTIYTSVTIRDVAANTWYII